MNHHTNLIRIKAVARALKELNNQVAFVGGAAVTLYADHPERMDLRVTDDIDVIIEVANYGKYMLLQERLRRIGFKEMPDSNVICRWKIEGVIVDIMPTDPDILGFSNPWYNEGLRVKEAFTIEDVKIFILPVSYFLATKLVALKERKGGVDWRWSSDFEDIVKLINEIDLRNVYDQSSGKLQDFMHDSFTEFLKDESYFYEACTAHLIKPFYSDDDIKRIINKLKLVVK